MPKKIFNWFVNADANARRAGDADKEKALLAEVFKLLGNSAYGKFIEAVERQMRTLYTKDEDEVDKQLRLAAIMLALITAALNPVNATPERSTRSRSSIVWGIYMFLIF